MDKRSYAGNNFLRLFLYMSVTWAHHAALIALLLLRTAVKVNDGLDQG